MDTGNIGKVALITGSASPSGLGYAIAKVLAKNGYAIILHDRLDATEVEPLREHLEKKCQVKAHYLRANLLQRSEIEEMCEKIKTMYPGGVDVLVNNAGVTYNVKLEEYPPQKWDETIGVHLTAPFDLTRLLLGDMKRKGWGRIINISSVRSRSASSTNVSYTAAKHGLNGLTKSTAMSSYGTGVTCNAICPALMETKIAKDMIGSIAEMQGISFEEAEKRTLADLNPSGAYVQVEQVAELAAFLCTPAADQITGAELPVDAGLWAK
ncbi:D-beta-hydroxybutyrate dehydrogenase-like isoform X1 [Ptychodera flava]|uniref:D-beta-hydroxybutyrate dehydrogenase-like isoform X1 n=1 Tax=Ptychodera flava TaxID=63121 RepID=UPI00396AA5FD